MAPNPYYEENEESGNTINWGRILAIIGIVLLVLLLLVVAGLLLRNSGFDLTRAFGGNSSGYNGNGGSFTFGANRNAKTTEDAKRDIGLDVMRLSEEAASFVWRGVGVGTSNAVCAVGYVCTLHLDNGRVIVVVGSGQSYRIWAGNFRFIKGFPQGDAVYENPPCTLLAKEQENGRIDVPSFAVEPEGFSCSGVGANTGNNGGNGNSNGTQNVGNTGMGGGNSNVCPTFGGRTLRVAENGSACVLDWNGQTVSDVVPAGWWAQTDTSGDVMAGQTVTVGSATFRRS